MEPKHRSLSTASTGYVRSVRLHHALTVLAIDSCAITSRWQTQPAVLRLLSKICKTRGIIPASYVLQPELVRVGKVRCGGGFADVSDGEYSGCSVAIKRLRTSEGASDRTFKVRHVDLIYYRFSSRPVVMSGDTCLETLVSSKYLASVGDFRICGSALFQYCHRMDAQWECDAVRKVKSKGKPPTTGETTNCSCDLTLIHPLLLAF